MCTKPDRHRPCEYLSMRSLTVALVVAVQQSDAMERARRLPVSGTPVIVAFGDSLTSGPGLRPEQAYPALLQQRIAAERARLPRDQRRRDWRHVHRSPASLRRGPGSRYPDRHSRDRRQRRTAPGPCRNGRTQHLDDDRARADARHPCAAVSDGGAASWRAQLHHRVPSHLHPAGRPLQGAPRAVLPAGNCRERRL